MRASSFSIAILAGLILLPLRALAAEPVGPENCNVCHPSAFAAWKDSGHARATGSLSPKQQKDRRCMTCHSPDQTKGVANVSCEGCHGGGQYYSARYVMKDPELARAVGLDDPTERTCRRCHDANAPSLKPFDFAERLKLIDHWSEERAERKAAAAKAPPKAKSPSKGGSGR